MIPVTFGGSLKRLRMERGLSQEELARLLGTSKQVISRYESGARVPKISTVSALAAALDAPLTALTGEADVFSLPGVERPRWQRVPLLGDIACGEPILAEENLEGYVEVDASVRCDFTLRCRGDSMEPRLHDGRYCDDPDSAGRSGRADCGGADRRRSHAQACLPPAGPGGP